MAYDYFEGVTNDLLAYIFETDGLWDAEEGMPAFGERADFVAHMNRVAPDEKTITGQVKGYMQDDDWYAEDCLAHNLTLLADACTAFHVEPDIARPRKCDALIRRYVVGACIEALADRFYGEVA